MCQKESIDDVVVQIECDRLTWEKLQEGKTKDGDCGNTLEKPKWFEEEQYLRGQKLLMDNLLCSMFCHLAGLILGVAIEVPYTVLANTGNHGSLKDLASRYLSTTNKIMKWYSTDIFDPTTEGAKSIAQVRKMHAASHRTMNRSHPKPGTNELWMSQFYMATTQISFVGLMMICPKAVGLGHLSEEEKEAIMHYWRCIGYLLGISDEYNVCSGTLDDLRTLTAAFVDNLLRPSMLEISSDKFNMARGILDSILKSIGNKFVTRNGFIAYWCPILQVDYNEKLSTGDRICILLMRLIYSSGITQFWIVRRFLNYRHEQRYRNAHARPNNLPDSLLNDFYGDYTMCPYLVKKTS